MESLNCNNIPRYLIIEFSDELPAFERVVCGLNMPTVDMNACLEQIFDVIQIAEDDLFKRMLLNVADYMGKGEGLYENARLDEFEQEQIVAAIIKIGIEIKARIKFLNIHIDGFMPYSFMKMLGKHAVILHIPEEYFGELNV